MNALRISLLKYFSLLAVLVCTIGNLWNRMPGTKALITLQIVFGSLYILFSVLEFAIQLKKTNLPTDRFFYFPLNFISRKFVKLGAFIIAGVVLIISESNLVFLGGILFIVVIADVLVFLLRYVKKVYYISLFNNYVLFSLEHEKQVYASQIKTIEYRYGIFYIQMNNGQTFPIEIVRIEKSLQKSFSEKFVMWAVINKLQFTDEAKEKLADVIASAV
jgi:hypothetical protein